MENMCDIPMALLTHCQLFTPHTCDDSFKIPVQLYEPIWLPKQCMQEVNAELSSLCLQVEALLVSSSLHSKDIQSGKSRGRSKVKFESLHQEEIIEFVNRMQDIVHPLEPTESLYNYLIGHDMGQVYPHLMQLLQHPGIIPDSRSLPSIPMDYFQYLSRLNNLMIMSQELNADNNNCSNHKYLAHQLALLHQTSNCLGDQTQWAKREIQSHFDAVRGACSQTSKKRIRLPLEETQWIDRLTRGLYSQASSFSLHLSTQQSVDSMLSLCHLINH
ncbi:hypothetical protein LOD99_12576 [Oopsacas minuta]|uniref:Uncharacterized protein n=1 Tax=Oopsacas minuta TaxID=111878 RepID=A0AAV7JCE7_9METZ|nr:hypothetical protein LOD99_12576 [Oopsacas minuta]